MRIQMWTPNGGASIEVGHDQVDRLKEKGFTTHDPNVTVKAPRKPKKVEPDKPKTNEEAE